MNDENIIEISNILDTFNIEEVGSLIKDEINSSEPDSILDSTNIFKPLYVKYMEITKQDISSEIKESVKDKFYKICVKFIESIFNKFSMEISEEWFDENYEDLPGITVILYNFFIIDLKNNITAIIINYIIANYKTIAENFGSIKDKKDAQSMYYKSLFNEEIAIIAINIHTICEWILDQLIDNDEFMKYIDTEYILHDQILKMMENGTLSDNFATSITGLFKKSFMFKSLICINIISLLKNKYALK